MSYLEILFDSGLRIFCGAPDGMRDFSYLSGNDEHIAFLIAYMFMLFTIWPYQERKIRRPLTNVNGASFKLIQARLDFLPPPLSSFPSFVSEPDAPEPVCDSRRV
jgi:hypothetical protein